MRGILAALRQNAHKAGGVKDAKPSGSIGAGKPPRTNGFHLTGQDYDKHLDVITNRLAETPVAVDALCFVLEKILNAPKDSKFRQINVTNVRYDMSIGKSGNWGLRFLQAVGFIENQTKEYYNLAKANLDLPKLRLAYEKLKRTTKLEVYQLAKDKISFSKEVEKLLEDGSVLENTAKQELLEKVPIAPKEGAAGSTKIRVYFGNGDISRMFASDDTLQSVLNWIAASFHTKIIDHLQNGVFELIDRTVYPPKILEISPKPVAKDDDAESELNLVGLLEDFSVTKSESRTLQHLNLWPSGELDIQKNGFLVRERALNGGPQLESN